MLSEKRIWIVGIVLALVLLAQTASASPVLHAVKWKQKGVYETTTVVMNVPYTVELYIYSDEPTTVTVEVVQDLVNWPDKVLARQTVQLVKGMNTVEIPFTCSGHVTADKFGEKPADLKNTRGVFVKVSDVYETSDVTTRLSTGTEVRLADFWFVSLKTEVTHNGQTTTYDAKDYAPVYSYDDVRCWGYITENGNPVDWGPAIYFEFVIQNPEHPEWNAWEYADAQGFFEHSQTAPDWAAEDVCGERGVFYHITAYDEEGFVLAYDYYRASYMCAPTASITITSVIGYSIAAIGAVALLIGAIRLFK